MSSNNLHPYWGQVIQYQARQQSQQGQGRGQASKLSGQQQPSKVQEGQSKDFGGFDSLIAGKDCFIKLGNGEAIKGLVSAASKYFYLVTAGGQVMVVNKAYVVMVMPVRSQNKNEDTGTLMGASVGPYGEKKA
jgi:sRNA-binding regulator protein Hfq